MMKSIKAKFTFTLTIVLFGVILLFATVIYFVNVNVEAPITPDVLERVGQANPRVGYLLESINQNQTVSEVYQLVREDQVDKYKNIFIILIPPTLLLSALIAYLVSSYLIKPIENLALYMKRIKSINMSERIPEVKTSSEVELVTKSFNTLLSDLENAFKLQDQFIQDAAHELRTPIAAMKTNIQVFKESQTNDKEDYEKLIKVIEKINDKLIKLNENLLFLNKNLKASYKFEETDLYSIVDEVLDTISVLAEKKHIQINNKIEPLTKIIIDPGKFSIAIKNILENAIKYSPDETEITIESHIEGNERLIYVKDNGIGIKKKDLDRIFDRFYRAENINPNQQEGEGLGLSIVKKIIEEHNAKIKVESEVDKGTIFTIYLPIEKEKKAA